jgi:hypothetical protein
MLSPDEQFGISCVPKSHVFLEQDPEGHRALAKVWRKELPEFDRLKRLALALGVGTVIVVPESATPPKSGMFLTSCFDDLREKDMHQYRNDWKLSREQYRQIIRLLRQRKPVILIDPSSALWEDASETLAHEIGHHIFDCLSGLSVRIQNSEPSRTMLRRTGFKNEDVRENRSELHAECFAWYLTSKEISKGRLDCCESLLGRVRKHNPKAAKLIEQYRLAVIRRTSQSEEKAA